MPRVKQGGVVCRSLPLTPSTYAPRALLRRRITKPGGHSGSPTSCRFHGGIATTFMAMDADVASAGITTGITAGIAAAAATSCGTAHGGDKQVDSGGLDKVVDNQQAPRVTASGVAVSSTIPRVGSRTSLARGSGQASAPSAPLSQPDI